MDWSLCIATLNRRDALLRTLRHAVAQTVPPREVVVIDVSDDWEETARLAHAEIFDARPEITLIYRTSPVRSSATQRNLGLGLCSSEIVFMIDDDSFLFPDCAEQILQIYKADTAGEVACVAISLVSEIPPLPGTQDKAARSIAQKESGNRQIARLQQAVLKSGFGRWINRKVLLQSMDELFIKYEGPRDTPVPASVAGLDVTRITFMQGCAMTVRREVALAEPFDPALRFYAAFEDLDATYRYGRHGVALRSARARLHHFEAAGGRIKRKKVIVFQLLNMALFIRRNTPDPEQWKGVYQRLLWRRLIGEFLKDGLSRRFDFPQVKGVLAVMGCWKELWKRSPAELDDWYPQFQKQIIDSL
ncbi:glycosyltransferase [Paenirhodobacter populi]|uniref:Glycosyltransferase family 2 protein n=1 Tax=Paenirhodobacter populi TaxID=2306993 RepID=A0A443IPZ5_9RHOB|nr:glycosyltransferase [Sinirhodobacter populi]RWR08162.1 glycosyltransferase family 2 protein [Sinirhodobacter populi]